MAVQSGGFACKSPVAGRPEQGCGGWGRPSIFQEVRTVSQEVRTVCMEVRTVCTEVRVVFREVKAVLHEVETVFSGR
jgi:hypothetical protein